MSDTPKTDNLCLDLDDGFARQSDLIAFARDLERENAALRKAKEMVELERCEMMRSMSLAQNQSQQLRADKERLDWLETQDCWIGVYGEYDINARICAGGSHSQRIRSAVDAARKEAQQ